MVVDGRCHDESAFGWLKKTGANPTGRGKQGVKRSLLTEATAIRWPSSSMVPTGMT